MTRNILEVPLNDFSNDTDTKELTGNPNILIRKDVYNNISLQTRVRMTEVIKNYPKATEALGISLITSESYNSKNAKLIAKQFRHLLEEAYDVDKNDFSDNDVQVKFTNLKEKGGKFNPSCVLTFVVCNTKPDVKMHEIKSFFEPALIVFNESLLTGSIFDDAVRKDTSVMGIFKRQTYGLSS